MRTLALVLRSARQSRLQLIGCALLLAGFQFVLVAQAAVFQESQAFGRIAEFMPSFLQRGLGPQALLLASFRGIIAFGYFHPLVVVLIAVLGAYFATEPAYDVETGRVDLLLARSVPRHRVITRSLLLALLAIVVTLAFMALGTWAGLRVYAPGQGGAPSFATIGRLILHLAALGAVFAAFALAVGAGASRWTPAFTTVVITAVLLYWIDLVAVAWPRLRALAWISPFGYYPALGLLAGTAPQWRNLLVLWAATLVLSGVAYWRFERRDL